MAETVQEPVDREQSQFGGAVHRLRHRTLHGDRHVADARSVIRWERQDVGWRVGAEESGVELVQLGITRQSHAQGRPRRHVQLISARTEE
jgi:hypothetical protein